MSTMLDDVTICVGTVGGGVHVSRDGGDSWTQVFKTLPAEGNVRALRVDPHDSERIWAGTDVGLFRSDSGGERWSYVLSPMSDQQIWSVAVDPTDPDKVYVGTRPCGFRSTDGGASWQPLPMDVVPECLAGVPRTTNLVVDPANPERVWAGVEIDGVHRSDDGGATWQKASDLGPVMLSADIHGLALRPGADGHSAVLATTPYGISTSTDDGESWELQQFPGFYEGNKRAYCRCVLVSPGDPDTIFVGTGDTIPGEVGALQISHDGGANWAPADLPTTPNSVVYWMASHPARPEVVAAASLYGYLYLSGDGGQSWTKGRREFGEVRALAVLPNVN